MSQTTGKQLYSDKFCTITDKGITIFWYYFPFGSKFIPFDDVATADPMPCESMISTTHKTWGMSLSPIWWACDFSRAFSNKDKQIVVSFPGKTMKSGFTAESPRKVLEIINNRANGTSL
eukprot:GFYU01002451.1.p2 GENE.GFYU01002451.1~~GFYU01002451.1.p2  ORF type:complete len:119 (-),score=5.76 GFYU01002451.1:87-443(-)